MTIDGDVKKIIRRRQCFKFSEKVSRYGTHDTSQSHTGALERH